MPQHDSGLAFPRPDGTPLDYAGMSKREWYAGMALAGNLSGPITPEYAKLVAEAATRMADAMVAALAEEPLQNESEPTQPTQPVAQGKKAVRMCGIEGCDRAQYAIGLCNNHYRGQRYAADRRDRNNKLGLCEWCVKPISPNKHSNSRFCGPTCATRAKKRRLAKASMEQDRSTCFIVDCDQALYAKGMCKPHHDQWRRKSQFAASAEAPF